MKQLITIILLVLIVIFFIYGLFKIKKNINYSMAYKTMVEETVKEMVKPEALK